MQKNSKKKIPSLNDADVRLEQVISDVGGHCRALEYLFDALESLNPEMDDYWNSVCTILRSRIKEKYAVGRTWPCIAYSFLSVPVEDRGEIIPNTTYLDLEKTGVIKLEPTDGLYVVKIPFVFIWGYMHSVSGSYTQFWRQMLIGQHIFWKEWEFFSRDYVAFRLSLYSFLGKQSVLLSEFFSGLISNLPRNTRIIIPPMEEIRTIKLDNQYPNKKFYEGPHPLGVCFLNADGAPFDAGVRLETKNFDETPNNTLIALQMKISSGDGTFNEESFLEEFNKVKDAFPAGTDIIFVMLCRSRKTRNFSVKNLPEKTVIVSNSELLAFYGDAYATKKIGKTTRGEIGIERENVA